MENLAPYFLHEYAMTLYGVILWQIEQFCQRIITDTPQPPFKKVIATIINSMSWGALVVVFDDELLARYNQWAQLDLQHVPLYGYLIAGVAVDIVVSKFRAQKDALNAIL